MSPTEASTLDRVLSDKEKEFLRKVNDYVDGAVSELIPGPDLYAIGDKLGISQDEVYRYSVSLGERQLLKIYEAIGRNIAGVMLTLNGKDYVILMR